MYVFEVSDFLQWRNIARKLVQAGIKPKEVTWQIGGQTSLFGNASLNDLADLPSCVCDASVVVPPMFLSQARQAAWFFDETQVARKWAVLYSLLWRLVHKDKHVLSLKSDPEVQFLRRMCKAVSRDQHKMKAFVRFQKVANADSQQQDYYVAWFEPAHNIVEPIAPFFVKRFTGMSWSILTPNGCAHWDQAILRLSNGVTKPELADDEFNEFWRAYYRHTFNPARLKEQAMRSEMPKKYWQYLPEAMCIKELTRDSAAVMGNMMAATRTNSERVRSSSDVITAKQDTLRLKNKV